MRAIRFVYRGTFARTMIGSLAIVLAFALLAFNVQPTATANPTQDMPDSPAATFPANAPSLGAVPDGPGAAGTCGADKNVTFTVAGMGAPLTNVEVSLTITHTWVGDIEGALLSPAGTATHLLFSRTGATTAASFGDDSNMTGPYNFKDSAAGTHWWTAAAGVPDSDVCSCWRLQIGCSRTIGCASCSDDDNHNVCGIDRRTGQRYLDT